MSDFEDRTDVQQMHIIALVMIPVLPGSAIKRPSSVSKEGLRCRKFTTFRSNEKRLPKEPHS